MFISKAFVLVLTKQFKYVLPKMFLQGENTIELSYFSLYYWSKLALQYDLNNLSYQKY